MLKGAILRFFLFSFSFLNSEFLKNYDQMSRKHRGGKTNKEPFLTKRMVCGGVEQTCRQID